MDSLILLSVLFGLLLLATPILIIVLFVKQATLRRQLNELAEENAKQHTKLQRAIGELQSKIATGVPPAVAAAEKPATSAPDISHPVAVPRPIPPVQIPPPVIVPPRVEVQPPLAAGQETVSPTPQVLPTQPKPATPAAPPKTVPAPIVPPPPAAPPPHPTTIPPAASARIATPPPTLLLKTLAPKTTR